VATNRKTMKKTSIILFVLFLGIAINGFSQTDKPAIDFFAAKWEMIIVGTPNGDAKMIANLFRKDGKLTGELSDPADATKEKIAITNLEEEATKITLYFTASGYDVNVTLEKVDSDNLKGQLMNMFETTAKRMK
jgi:hypothetical protein